KRLANVRKHRVDFQDLGEMFSGKRPLKVRLDSRRDYGEDRWIGIGRRDGVTLFVVFTEPEEGVIRFVSARKAVGHEKKIIEEETRKHWHGLGFSSFRFR